ncbi:MAG: hypothetical protein ACI8PZ_007566 [Myxococcota bacterium]|jgi:hypothetical protein
MPEPPHTIAETKACIARADKLLSLAEREEVVYLIASNPTAGVLIQGTGGIRKLRFGLQGRGKSGGVRVIYFLHDQAMPIYLLALFAKNEKADLTMTERLALRQLTTRLVAAYRGKK